MKDLFVVDFGVERTFDVLAVTHPKMAWLFAGPLGKIVRRLAKDYLAKSIALGVIEVDLTADAVVIAHEKAEYKERAEALYKHALLKVYTDEEKENIRYEYVDLLRHLSRLRKRD